MPTTAATTTTTTAGPLVAINQTAVSEEIQRLTDNVVKTASKVVQAPFKYINSPTAQTSANEIAAVNTGKFNKSNTGGIAGRIL